RSGEDLLAFANTGNITGNFNPGNGALTLSGADTVANYQAALRSVTYQNTSDNPSTLLRTVSFQVNDGAVLSLIANRTIQIGAVNDAPTLSGIEAAALSYTENAPAVPLTSTLTVADVDNATLSGATVQVTGNYRNGEDVLAFPNTGSISGNFNSGTGTLTLSGADTAANFQTALRSVTYQITSVPTRRSSDLVSFQVNDGAVLSLIANRAIQI